MNRKQKFITAYSWLLGFTKREAEETYKTADEEYINVIIDVFERNAKLSFYNN